MKNKIKNKIKNENKIKNKKYKKKKIEMYIFFLVIDKPKENKVKT